MNDVDARRARVGDLLKVRTYSALSVSGGTRIPPGSVITGHITDVSKLGKGEIESRLAVVFDQAQMASGQTVVVHMGIAGLAAAPPVEGLANQQGMTADMESPFQGARSTGLTVDPSGQKSTANTTGGTGGTRVTRGALSRTASSPNGALNDAGSMSPGDHVGGTASVGSTVPGISLRSSSTAQSVLVSTSNNIALRSGTPLVLLPIADPQQ